MLILALLLSACQQAADSVPDADPVEAVILAEGEVAAEVSPATQAPQASELTARTEDGEQTQTSAVPVDNLYQEGFTDQGEPFRGNPNAAIVIEEFSSYQCPFCTKYFLDTYPQVVSNHVRTEQVLYIFRDFPLQNQPQSLLASEAANCAGRLGGASTFWIVHEWLFDRQTDWSGKGNAATLFEGYANELGLDATAFAE